MATNWHSIVYTCRFATGNDSVSNFSGNVTLTRASHGPCTTSTREWRHLIWLLLSYGRSAIFVSALKESKGFCLDCLSHLTHRTKKSNIENMKVHTHTHTHTATSLPRWLLLSSSLTEREGSSPHSQKPNVLTFTLKQMMYSDGKCDLGPRAWQGRRTDVTSEGWRHTLSGNPEMQFSFNLGTVPRTGRVPSIISMRSLWGARLFGLASVKQWTESSRLRGGWFHTLDEPRSSTWQNNSNTNKCHETVRSKILSLVLHGHCT